MAYQEEEQVRIRRQRTKNAIALAMQGRWQEAVAANKEIIESFPNDVDAYNRLGKAYMELGEYALAKEAYSRAIELDSYNIIAQKNLRRLALLERAAVAPEAESDKAKPEHFIKETGKAGVVNLYRLGPREVLVKMVAGDKVYLKINDSSLDVENSRGEYLGVVEPRHAQRLIKLIEGGNRYTAAIVSSAEDRVTVIIREVYQHPSQADQLSFPLRRVEGPRPVLEEKMLQPEFEPMETVGGEPIEGEIIDNPE